MNNEKWCKYKYIDYNFFNETDTFVTLESGSGCRPAENLHCLVFMQWLTDTGKYIGMETKHYQHCHNSSLIIFCSVCVCVYTTVQ